ncbi:uncharacterized protein IWZ02DRAFT_60557 [Phyllosticta citriasiana]|uniref:uncharacterized protein n=1 Tax=Phyllosticta citriasiana TaxID=595635 RepID=UPI0030FDB769
MLLKITTTTTTTTTIPGQANQPIVTSTERSGQGVLNSDFSTRSRSRSSAAIITNNPTIRHPSIMTHPIPPSLPQSDPCNHLPPIPPDHRCLHRTNTSIPPSPHGSGAAPTPLSHPSDCRHSIHPTDPSPLPSFLLFPIKQRCALFRLLVSPTPRDMTQTNRKTDKTTSRPSLRHSRYTVSFPRLAGWLATARLHARGAAAPGLRSQD